MANWKPRRGERHVWALGLVLAATLSWLFFVLAGWLGVGLLGLLILVVANCATLYGDGMPDFDYGLPDLDAVARQMEEKRRVPENRQEACRTEKGREDAIAYFINTFGITLAVLGFALFSRHEF